MAKPTKRQRAAWARFLRQNLAAAERRWPGAAARPGTACERHGDGARGPTTGLCIQCHHGLWDELGATFLREQPPPGPPAFTPDALYLELESRQ